VMIGALLLIPAVFVGAEESQETLREQARARDVEKNGHPPRTGVMDPGSRDVNGDGGLLFIGVDDDTVPTYIIDPADNGTTAQFTGYDIWGAALIPGASAGDAVVYFVDGSTLFRWPSNGTPEECCSLQFSGANTSMVSAAYNQTDGKLLFSKNISTEAIYSLPVTADSCPPSCDVAQDIIYATTHDIGGLAYDDATSTIYGTDDGTSQVVTIKSDGSVDPVVAYPAGETDIDGLAYGDGRLYLVTDEPGDIYVYNVDSGVFETPLTNPWTSSEIFSGAAFGNGLIPVELMSWTVE